MLKTNAVESIKFIKEKSKLEVKIHIGTKLSTGRIMAIISVIFRKCPPPCINWIFSFPGTREAT